MDQIVARAAAGSRLVKKAGTIMKDVAAEVQPMTSFDRRHQDRDIGPGWQHLDVNDVVGSVGKVLAMKDTQVTVQDLLERREWKLPYAAIEPSAPNAPARAQAAAAAPPPAPPKLTRNDFRCGEKVAFKDKYLQTVVGTIVRMPSMRLVPSGISQ